MRRCLTAFWLILLSLVLATCQSQSLEVNIDAHARAASTGALTVSGACNVPDGTRLLVRVQGPKEKGVQLEQAVLAPVRDGRFVADLNLYETLAYQIDISLSPLWNVGGALPATAPTVTDATLSVRKRGQTWEVCRKITARLGTAEQEKELLTKHYQNLKEAWQALNRSVETLRELEKQADRRELSRWFRLHCQRKQKTMLKLRGIDPLFPDLHSRLYEAEKAIEKRFHAVLASLTGGGDEVDKLSKNWDMVELHLRKASEALDNLSEKLNE